MSLTGETKSSAITLTSASKNAVTLRGVIRAGQGWEYNDPNLTYDGATDLEGRAVLYDSIGQTITLTPLTKNNV